MKYTVVLIPDSEKGYTAIVPTLPGCVTQGETISQVSERAKEAIECYLDSLEKDNEPIPEEGELHTLQLKVAV
ncbi:type II toxin-antitoxin system HicB family antitoxin [candidate division WOR-3 bacterium]|nr:type II toxin-antitoxin system HicB family antitoxin [candidate division WOR-3 bacterium]